MRFTHFCVTSLVAILALTPTADSTQVNQLEQDQLQMALPNVLAESEAVTQPPKKGKKPAKINVKKQKKHRLEETDSSSEEEEEEVEAKEQSPTVTPPAKLLKDWKQAWNKKADDQRKKEIVEMIKIAIEKYKKKQK